jgi:hypothetical protein
VTPVDPGRHWLEAGITGLSRQREWDAVATAAAPGEVGDEVELVVLAGGRVLPEQATSALDPTPLVDALSLAPPYRAVGVRREELWVVGARSIEVERLAPDPPGDELELTWDGSVQVLSVDGRPFDASAAPALERLAASRERGPYAAHAQRLVDDLWEVLVLPL